MRKEFKYKCYIVVYFLLLVFLLKFHNLSAQEYRYTNFTSENGLSNNTVNCIFQDKYGFLWIGTNNGLNKYDGYIFTNYHANPADSSSLSSDFITSIVEDITGNLWIGTVGGGLNRFDINTQSFFHYKFNKTVANSETNIDIISLSPDNFGNIWIGTKHNGIYKFNIYFNDFTNYKNGSPDFFNTATDSINVINFIGNSKLLIGTTSGLTNFDFKNNITKTYKHSNNNKSGLCNNFIYSIFKDKSDQIWIGTANSGFQNFNLESGSFSSYNIFENNKLAKNCNINCITEDKENNLIISTDIGYEIFKFNKLNYKLGIINYDYQSSKISAGIVLNTLYVDCNNILWIGNYNMGIGKYNLYKPKFDLISLKNETNKSEIGRKIRAICTDDKSNLWLASLDGLILYNRDKGFTKIYENIQDKNINFRNNMINSVIKDEEDNLWIGTAGGGLNKFETENEKFIIFKHTQNNNNSVGSNFIQTLFLDKDKILWIGTADNGISTYDTKIKKFNTIPITFTDSNLLKNDNISIIYEDKFGEIWIGTHTAGLVCYNKKSDKITRFRFDASNKNSINSDKILSICEDKIGKMWIGTGNGLEEYDRNTNSFYHYLNKDGLVYEVINAMLIDEKNNLWMATNNGITKFKISEKNFRVYNLFDGLQGREFHQSSCKSNDGEFFFCGVNGVNHFFPDSIIDKPNNSTLILTSFKTAGNSIRFSEDICERKEINLNHSDNSFSFSFALLDFTKPSFYTYAFKLEGLDKDWSYTKNTRSATYSNLAPGKYMFTVKANNSDDVWSKPISISIYISPPFWKSWWFYTILVISVLTVAF
ncbi:MAG: triple tyrosine motif-containing protein, partial [Ignavibacteriae bacterium]|nr:triple tyrosine motif-containing protein [Ignavibacteriota bacterium]